VNTASTSKSSIDYSDLLIKVRSLPEYSDFTAEHEPGKFRKPTNGNTSRFVLDVTGLYDLKNGEQIKTLHQIGVENSLIEGGQSRKKPTAEWLYEKSSCNSEDREDIKKYFSGRCIEITDTLIDEMGIRINRYKGLAVIIPMKNPAGNIIQLHRIIIDPKTYTNVSKKLIDSANSRDRGLFLKRGQRLVIFEGVEDALTWLLKNPDDSILVTFGTSGFKLISSFIKAYKGNVALYLDPDEDNQSMKMSHCLGPDIGRFIPTLGFKIDANRALQQGQLDEWIQSLRPVQWEEVKQNKNPTGNFQEIKVGVDQSKKILEDLSHNILAKQTPLNQKFNLDLVPPSIRDYILELSKTTDAEPVTLLMSFIVSFSVVSRHKIYFESKMESANGYFQRLYANIWSIVLNGSGQFKTTALKRGSHIMRELETESNRHTLATGGSMQGFRADVEENNGGGLLISEFKAWMNEINQNHNQGFQAMLTDWYDVPDKAIHRIVKDGKVIIVRRPFISICGASTMAWFKEFLSAKEIDSGFLARFLFFCPPQNRTIPPFMPREKGRVDPNVTHRVRNIFTQISSKQDGFLKYRFTPDAERLAAEFHDQLYQQAESVLDEQSYNYIESYLKRWSPYIVKLAMLFQQFHDNTTDLISCEAVESAKAVLAYSIQSTTYLIQNKLKSPFQDKADRVLTWLAKGGTKGKRAKGTAKYQELITSNLFTEPDFKGSESYDKVLEYLEHSGQLSISGSENGTKKERVINLINTDG